MAAEGKHDKFARHCGPQEQTSTPVHADEACLQTISFTTAFAGSKPKYAVPAFTGFVLNLTRQLRSVASDPRRRLSMIIPYDRFYY